MTAALLAADALGIIGTIGLAVGGFAGLVVLVAHDPHRGRRSQLRQRQLDRIVEREEARQ